MKRITIKIVFVLLLAFILSACTMVQPWERESLAKPIMIFDKNPIDKGIKLHHIEYREGSAGSEGSQSGGCGCG